MTLCIAATCQLNKNPTIIHCTDRRADLGYAGSADNLPKMKEIGKSWMLSMASSNWTVSDHLVGHIQGCFLAASQAPKQVDELKKLISDGIAAFSNSGEYKNADTELLVSGYLDATIPTIINVTLNGKKSALSIIGEFAGSIGHGQYIAKVFLAQREYSVYDDLETALYKIYEAKKYG